MADKIPQLVLKTVKDVEDFRARFANDPVAFAKILLGVKELDPYFQPQLLDAVAKHGRVAIKGGKGAGKTVDLAILALWWKCTRKNSKVLLMANTHDQAKSTLFGYAVQMCQAPECRIADWFDVTAEAIRLKGSKDPSFAIMPGSVSTKGEHGAGKHAENMLVICDEAEAFDNDRWEIIVGNATEENAKLVASGNPTRLHVPFHKIFTEWSSNWHLLTVDSRKAKFVSQTNFVIPYMNERGNDLDHPMIRANVLGEFPKESLSAYIPADCVREGRKMKLDAKALEGWPFIMGVDLAFGGGDDAGIVIRQGRAVVFSELRRDRDTVTLRERVVDLVRQYNVSRVCIDVTGGAITFSDELRKYLPFNSLCPVNFASRASNPLLHNNRRQELWARMREALRSGLDLSKIPQVIYDRLHMELAAVEVTTDNSKGQERILAKSEIKERLGFSPDLSDSLALTYNLDLPKDSGKPTFEKKYPMGQPIVQSGGPSWMG